MVDEEEEEEVVVGGGRWQQGWGGWVGRGGIGVDRWGEGRKKMDPSHLDLNNNDGAAEDNGID